MRASMSPLFRSVALGLSLAAASLSAASLAHAGPLAAKRAPTHAQDVAAHMAEIQQKMQQHAELSGLISNPGQHVPDLHVLQLFNARFHPATQGIPIASKRNMTIEARGAALVVVDGAGEARPAQSLDLVNAGITSKAELEAAVARHTHSLAGLKQTANSNAAAVEALTKQIRSADELIAILGNPSAHEPSLGTLNAYWSRFGKGAGLKIAGAKGGVIQAVGNEIQIVDGKGEARRAQTADLVAVGITDKASFASAVAKRLHTLAGVKHGEDSTPAAMQALAAKVQAADSLVAQVQANADIALLRSHHVAVTQARGIAAGDLHLFGTEGSDELVVTASNVQRMKSGAPMAVSYADLARHQASTQAEFDAQVGLRLMRVAGLKGNAVTAKSVEKARARLQQEINDVNELNAAIQNPLQATDKIAFVRQVHATMPPTSDGQPRQVRLATADDGSTLEVRLVTTTVFTTTYSYQQRRNISYHAPQSADRIVVVDASNPAGRLATIADLHRFGIADKADLEAAAGDAVLGLAKEDLPL